MGKLTTVAAALIGFVALSCGSDSVDRAMPSTSTRPTTSRTATPDAPGTTVTSATTPPSTPTAPPSDPPTTEADAALEFFRSTEAECAAHAGSVGNSPVLASHFAGARAEGEAPGGGWIIVDGAGNRFVVDIDERVVFSPDGRDAVLPPEYSFGCPETIFLGSAWD